MASLPVVLRVRDMLECLSRWEPRLLTEPGTAELVVRGPAVLDVRELTHGDGAIVLAAGVGATGIKGLLEHARSIGASLVVARADALESLASLDDVASCALVSLTSPASWRDVDAALDVALSSTGSTPLPGLSYSATGDLFALANAVAAAVGGATTVEDTEMRVLSYSNWPQHPIDDLRRSVILQRQVSKDASPEQYQQLMREHKVLRFHGPGQFPRIAVAVRAAGRVLGYLWVIEAEPFGAAEQESLAKAADAAAPHLLRFLEINSSGRDYRADSVRRILDGRGTNRDLDVLRLTAQTSLMVVAFRCVVFQDGSAEVITDRLADLIGVYVADAGGVSAIAVTGDTVHVLLRAPADPERVMPMIERLVKQAEAALDVTVYAGLGRRVRGPREVPLSAREADLIVATLSRDGCGMSTARFDDVLDEAVVHAILDLLAERPELRHPGVQTLVERDANKAGVLAPTLLAFINSNSDYQSVANDLNVHVNTVRYRVQKACEVGGIELSDGLERFVVWLQLIAVLRQQTAHHI